MKTHLFFSALLLAVLPACLQLNSDEQQAEHAEKAVLAKHDELMAQMDRLTELRQQLQRTPGPDTALAARQRRALLAADAGMMDWMHRYRRPADTVAAARRLAYYGRQQQKIDSVAGLFRTSQDSVRLVLQTAGAPASSAH